MGYPVIITEVLVVFFLPSCHWAVCSPLVSFSTSVYYICHKGTDHLWPVVIFYYFIQVFRCNSLLLKWLDIVLNWNSRRWPDNHLMTPDACTSVCNVFGVQDVVCGKIIKCRVYKAIHSWTWLQTAPLALFYSLIF